MVVLLTFMRRSPRPRRTVTALVTALLTALLAPLSAAGATEVHPAIIGGSNAVAGTLPWLAFIENSAGSGYELCTGTVVSRDVVLTAGHCAEDPVTGSVNASNGYRVVTGSLDWTGPSRQVSAVSQVIVDPGYNPATGQGDAALLMLASPTTAPSIRLATVSDAQWLAPGTLGAIAGWGETAGGDQASIPTALQYATTTVQGSTFCARSVAPFHPQTQLCAVSAPSFDRGTCFGDSGGPLVANDFAGDAGTPVELGITTEVGGNCLTTLPDVFTRVDSVTPWADRVIAAATPSPSTSPSSKAPTRSPAPPPTSTAIAPVAGRYRGSTAQRWPISLRVAANRRTFTALTFGYGLICRAHHHRFAYSIHTQGSGSIQGANGLRFSVSFSDTVRVRYRLNGAFTRDGRAAGTLRAVWRTPRYGRCDSGTVRWRAQRVRG